MPRRGAFRSFLVILSLSCVWAAGASTVESPDLASLSAEAQQAIHLLQAHDLYDRQKGFMRLELLRDPATLPVVRLYLNDRNADIRSFAIRALAAINGINAVPELVNRLKTEKHPTVRIAIILGLEPLQDPAILPAFIQRLRDRNPEVRIAALDAVSRFKAPEAREALLLRQQRERDRDVQRVLQDALRRNQAL